MLYFAYGSNMNKEQMAKRCKGAKFLGVARLDSYKFVFDGSSKLRGCAVANVIPDVSSFVLGGLWEISTENRSSLDCYEGYPDSYHRIEVSLTTSDGKRIDNVLIYLRSPKQLGVPSDSYRNICIQGAHDCGLPEEYINKILA